VAFLTRTDLAQVDLLAEVSGPGRGGIALFFGTVRDHHQGRRVRGIEYTAYEEMAEPVCRSIIGEAEERWAVRVTLRHRLGELMVGDIAVGVAAAGAHREEAFAACRYVIEEVKRRVPIWKRERFEDGTEEWVDPTAPGIGGRRPAIERHP
jgi:molybdopterin synthase catalytic subunit